MGRAQDEEPRRQHMADDQPGEVRTIPHHGSDEKREGEKCER